ncbi:MAG: aspartate-semialdehyde dehydrogenase [Acidobacteriota bacterium]|nr:aspartate-semialdehyde dehydrogenase [Blastocatellia bacterium]MDW8411618.1 aspartate-semialdehyde dehydrogenase [Acidobacteriota bacterium]
MKYRVGILGATGLVGQRFVQMLEDHPLFEITALAASDRSEGKVYEDVCPWKLASPIPEKVRKLTVQACTPPLDCDLVFSSLPSSMAGAVEEAFAAAGYPVISNSSNHRMDDDVPLLVPEINSAHLAAIEHQKQRREWSGYIVTNPNCTTIALVLALAPLHTAFGIEAVSVVSMQALSGAGYPGVASLDAVDNLIPYIDGEEEKVENEPLKILGQFEDGRFNFADFRISAQCNRVPVTDGHTEAVAVKLRTKTDVKSVIEVLQNFRAEPQLLKLHSAPEKPVVVLSEQNRPQPRLDRNIERGMATVVGRVRKDNILDFKFVLLGHNTIRGAAGAALLNAELLVAKNFLRKR